MKIAAEIHPGNSAKRLVVFRWVVIAIGAALVSGLISVTTATIVADSRAQEAANAKDPNLAIQQWKTAIRLRPDIADYYRGLAAVQADGNPELARKAAAHAAQLNPGDWQNWRALGLLDFQLGRGADARRDLARGSHVNQGFESHLELAEMNLLEGNNDEFWQQISRAWAMSAPEAVPTLVVDTLRAPGFTVKRFVQLMPEDAIVRANTIGALIRFHRVGVAAQLWLPTRCRPDEASQCRGAAMSLVTELCKDAFRHSGAITQQELSDALVLWQHGVRDGYLAGPVPRPGYSTDPGLQSPGTEDFNLPWVGPRFSWLNNSDVEIHDQPGGGVVANFSGYQPDTVLMGAQYVAVCGGCRYVFTLQARSLNQASGAINIVVALQTPGGELTHLNARSDGSPIQATIDVPAGVSGLLLNLKYTRALGEPPFHGTILLQRIALEPAP